MLLVVVGCGSSNPAGGDDAGAGDDAMGDGMSSCAAGQWCTEVSPVANTLLHAVSAVNTGDVFAVGDTGTILRRANNTWTAMQSGTTENLRGVWALDGSDAWAVGEAGTILRYDGTSWAPVGGAGTLDLFAVWGTSANDVYVSGTGTVLHWNGSMFSTMPIAGDPFAISGLGTNDVWVTGENSRVAHFNGTWTTGINPGAGNTYFGVLAMAANDVWVSTFTPGKETLRFDGSTWTPHPAAGTGFLGFHGITASDIWAAGGSKVGHWDGSTWTTESPGGPAAQFWGVSGAGSFVWIVGSDSLILHRN